MDGAAAVVNDNLRLQIYRQGTVLIPNGISQARNALTAYTNKNCQGESRTYGMYDEQGNEIFNTDLGTGFDNNIRSFKLRKGFMAVIANNPDGTGHSRCFIADKDDLVVNDLPNGFVTKDGSDKSFVSFIRITKWERVSKKGWAGSDPNAIDLTNATCYFGWEAGSVNKSAAAEYTPMRHHRGWPGFDEIKKAVNVSHVLSYNEADNRPDTGEREYPDNGILEWPEHMRTGLRLGSPTLTAAYSSWLTKFLNTADSLNYRVDFVNVENYIHRNNCQPEIEHIATWSGGRPVWITEYNNGANWTTSNDKDWVDLTGVKCDADGVQVPGADMVTLPNTPGNADVQYNYIKSILKNMDETPVIERHFFYNWVQDARSMILDGKLTKAGKYFSEYNADFAYNDANAYHHEWKIAPPFPLMGRSEDYKQSKLTWYDHNGETGLNYEVFAKLDGGEYELIATLECGKDYQPGATVEFMHSPGVNKGVTYKIRATSYKGEKSIFSREKYTPYDELDGELVLTGQAKDYRSVTLSWNAIEGIKGFLIERADAESGEFKPIYSRDYYYYYNTGYTDSGLDWGKDYLYRIHGLSNNLETPVSNVVRVHVASIDEAPFEVSNLIVGAGDGVVNLRWDSQYQVTYDIFRSDDKGNPLTKLNATPRADNTYKDTTVENGVTYSYVVKGYRYDLEGPATEPVSVTPCEGNVSYIPFYEGMGTTFMDVYRAQPISYKSNYCKWIADRNDNERSAIMVGNNIHNYIGNFSVGPKVLPEDNYTISFWINPTETYGRVITKSTGSGDRNPAWTLMYSDRGKWTLSACPLGENPVNQEWFSTATPDKWYNVTITYDNETWKLYIDGKELGAVNNLPRPTVSALQLVFGESSSNASGAMFGLDDFYIFNKCLDAAGVNEVMNREGLSEVEDIEAAVGLSVRGERGIVVIDSAESVSLPVYDIAGKLIRILDVQAGNNRFDGFATGLYLVGANKVIVK